MKKGKKIYEGKAKILYKGPEKNTAIQLFKDHATAFNNQKKSTISKKGILNNMISDHIFKKLNKVGVKTHLIKRLNSREQLIHMLEIIPIEFIVRNIATGSLTKRLGIPDGTILKKPLLEYSYKNDELGDPLIAREHILAFNWSTTFELNHINSKCIKINIFLSKMFILNYLGNYDIGGGAILKLNYLIQKNNFLLLLVFSSLGFSILLRFFKEDMKNNMIIILPMFIIYCFTHLLYQEYVEPLILIMFFLALNTNLHKIYFKNI